jgi:hypothetical protein
MACDSQSPFPGSTAACINKKPGHTDHYAAADTSDPENPGYEVWGAPSGAGVQQRIDAQVHNRSKAERIRH